MACPERFLRWHMATSPHAVLWACATDRMLGTASKLLCYLRAPGACHLHGRHALGWHASMQSGCGVGFVWSNSS
jgi:hypothetical protein